MSKSLQSDTRKRLARLLAERRKTKGLTQAELARAMGRHQPFIANIESDERRVNVIELLEICRLVGCDANKLIDILSEHEVTTKVR